MLTAGIFAIHVIVCILLAVIILMQSGRGGGLTEGFGGGTAENLFGAKTSSFLIKGTTVLSIIFLVTCLSLAFLSRRSNESIMTTTSVMENVQQTTAETADQTQQQNPNPTPTAPSQ